MHYQNNIWRVIAQTAQQRRQRLVQQSTREMDDAGCLANKWRGQAKSPCKIEWTRPIDVAQSCSIRLAPGRQAFANISGQLDGRGHNDLLDSGRFQNVEDVIRDRLVCNVL